jgi:hypothetical protein
MDCAKAQNAAKCPCSNLDCERRGLCCQCLSTHLAHKTLPRCCFPAEPATPPGRSFQDFAKAWKV